MEARGFISAIIGHIPDRNFKMIRYYGVYERTRKKFYRGLLNRYKSMRSADSDDKSEKRLMHYRA